jgi:hypothetical protein
MSHAFSRRLGAGPLLFDGAMRWAPGGRGRSRCTTSRRPGHGITPFCIGVRDACSSLDRFLARMGPLAVPVLVGVLPSHSSRDAEFLHNEVPGMTIPDHARARLHDAGDGAPGRASSWRRRSSATFMAAGRALL